MKETVESRALKIAATAMQAAGLCRYASGKCRRTYVDESICVKCIREGLISRAKRELRKEGQKYGQ